METIILSLFSHQRYQGLKTAFIRTSYYFWKSCFRHTIFFCSLLISPLYLESFILWGRLCCFTHGKSGSHSFVGEYYFTGTLAVIHWFFQLWCDYFKNWLQSCVLSAALYIFLMLTVCTMLSLIQTSLSVVQI